MLKALDHQQPCVVALVSTLIPVASWLPRTSTVETSRKPPVDLSRLLGLNSQRLHRHVRRVKRLRSMPRLTRGSPRRNVALGELMTRSASIEIAPAAVASSCLDDPSVLRLEGVTVSESTDDPEEGNGLPPRRMLPPDFTGEPSADQIDVWDTLLASRRQSVFDVIELKGVTVTESTDDTDYFAICTPKILADIVEESEDPVDDTCLEVSDDAASESPLDETDPVATISAYREKRRKRRGRLSRGLRSLFGSRSSLSDIYEDKLARLTYRGRRVPSCSRGQGAPPRWNVVHDITTRFSEGQMAPSSLEAAAYEDSPLYGRLWFDAPYAPDVTGVVRARILTTSKATQASDNDELPGVLQTVAEAATIVGSTPDEAFVELRVPSYPDTFWVSRDRIFVDSEAAARFLENATDIQLLRDVFNNVNVHRPTWADPLCVTEGRQVGIVRSNIHLVAFHGNNNQVRDVYQDRTLPATVEDLISPETIADLHASNKSLVLNHRFGYKPPEKLKKSRRRRYLQRHFV